MLKRYQSDIAIIGGGLSGIVAAIELLDKNRKVLIIDRDKPENFGGLAQWSAGGLALFNSPIQKKNKVPDSIELGMQDWFRLADFGSEDVWPKKWAEKYVHSSVDYIYEWLIKKSIKFLPLCLWVERGVHEPINSVPRFHVIQGGGAELMRCLKAHLHQHPNAKNLTILFNHRVEGFDLKEGRVVGCYGKIEDTEEEFVVSSEHSIVAAGGMCGGDLSYIRKNWYTPWGSPPTTLLNGAHRFADGLLHESIQKIGAKVTHLDLQWCYPSGIHQITPDKPHHGFNLISPPSAIWINALGKRIGPTPLMGYSSHRYCVEQICKQPGQYSWQILNWKIAIKEIFVSGCSLTPGFSKKSRISFLMEFFLGRKKLIRSLLNNCVDFIEANSLPELVEKMNALENPYTVDLKTLESDLRNYDAQIDRGKAYFTDVQLQRLTHYRNYYVDRLRVCKYQKILDKKAFPLIAIREFVLTRKSLGGVQTDLTCRVLDHEGRPIPGLYAVGEFSGCGGGGAHGKGSLEGTYLGSCILTARILSESFLR